MAEELHMGHNSGYDGKGVKGALWTIAGTTIGALASNVLGVGNGGGRGLFNIVGGGCGGCACDPAGGFVTYRDSQKDARIAELETDKKFLEANIYTDKKITEAYASLDAKIACLNQAINAQAVVNANVTATLACQGQQVASLMGLTSLSVQASKVCPEPMARYNSWTAPAAAAA